MDPPWTPGKPPGIPHQTKTHPRPYQPGGCTGGYPRVSPRGSPRVSLGGIPRDPTRDPTWDPPLDQPGGWAWGLGLGVRGRAYDVQRRGSEQRDDRHRKQSADVVPTGLREEFRLIYLILWRNLEKAMGTVSVLLFLVTPSIYYLRTNWNANTATVVKIRIASCPMS